MKELLAFAAEHQFLAWCSLWLLWAPVIIVVALIRHVSVLLSGWPPVGLDEDGDPIEGAENDGKPRFTRREFVAINFAAADIMARPEQDQTDPKFHAIAFSAADAFLEASES